jgi:hypothetical protein
MSKEIKYARVKIGDKILDQILHQSVKGRPAECPKPNYETIKKIRWETSEDGNHTDLVIETNYSIISYNERYVISWGIF